MIILIATANRELVEKLNGKPLKGVEPQTKNTMIFSMRSTQFQKLQQSAIAAGHNPFALFTW